MLLAHMISDEKGHLFGGIEEGREVPLSCPHPHAVVGKARYNKNQGRDLAMERAFNSLHKIAKIDTGKYYFLSEGNHNGDGNIYFIPYITFEK